ncbi:kinase-like protein [Nannochloropsis oceanica]
MAAPPRGGDGEAAEDPVDGAVAAKTLGEGAGDSISSISSSSSSSSSSSINTQKVASSASTLTSSTVPAVAVADAPSTPVLLAVAFSHFQSQGSTQGDDGRVSPALKALIPRAYAVKDRLTRDLLATYEACNPQHHFKFKVPRRILTQPAEPAQNDGRDNSEANLICSVGDALYNAGRGCTFAVLDLLGQGTFGQVFKCQEQPPQQGRGGGMGGGGEGRRKPAVAIKVVKSKPAYLRQAQSEVGVLRLLNEKHDPGDEKHLVRLLDSFTDKGHLCLVFELLDMNLYELLKQNQFRGLPLSLIRHFASEIVEALGVMEEAGIIHCDLKPENILLATTSLHHQPKVVVPTDPTTSSGSKNSKCSSSSSNRRKHHSSVKVIDFGSACFEGRTMYTYIQSRFYRSPEVLLGLPYDAAIDMWSLGCICAEMFLGLPIFPGVSEHNQLSRVVEMLGAPPEFMLEHGKNTAKYFHRRRRRAEGGREGGLSGGLGGQLEAYRSTFPARGGGATLAKVGEEEAATDAMLVPQQQDVGTGVGAKRAGGLLLKSHTLASALQPLQQQQHQHKILPSPSASSSNSIFALKTAEEYASDTRTPVVNSKKYFKHKRLPDIVRSYPYGRRLDPQYILKEDQERRLFLNLVLGLLDLNPWKRWTAKQAAEHPFFLAEPGPEREGVILPYEPPDKFQVLDRRLHGMLLSHQQRSDAHKVGGSSSQENSSASSSSSSSRGPPLAYLAAAAGSVGHPPPFLQPGPSEPLAVPQPVSPIPSVMMAGREGEGLSIFRQGGSSSGSSAGGQASLDEGLVRSAPAFHRLRIMNRRASVGSAVAAGFMPSTPQTAPGLAMSMGVGGGGGSMVDGSGGAGYGGRSHVYPPEELDLPPPYMQQQMQQQQQQHPYHCPQQQHQQHQQQQQHPHHQQLQQQQQQQYGHQQHHQYAQHAAALSPSLGQGQQQQQLQPVPAGMEGEFAEWDPFFLEPLEDDLQLQLQQHEGGRPRASSYGSKSPRLPHNGHAGNLYHQYQQQQLQQEQQQQQHQQQQYSNSHHGPPSPIYHQQQLNHTPSHNTPPKQRFGAFSFLRSGGPPRHQHRGGQSGGIGSSGMGSGGTGGAGVYSASPGSTGSGVTRPRSSSWHPQHELGAGSGGGGIGVGGSGIGVQNFMPLPSGNDHSAVWSTGGGGGDGCGPPNNNSSTLNQQQRRRSGSGSGSSPASGSSWMVRRAVNPTTGLSTEAYGMSPRPQGGIGGGGSTGGIGKKPPASPRGALGTSPSKR